ncbi:MAG: hypothetical protein JWN24_5021 [Phycisphaerales bacterium]|nr:hypothetical protein [Phycisphaerales bacterium]
MVQMPGAPSPVTDTTNQQGMRVIVANVVVAYLPSDLRPKPRKSLEVLVHLNVWLASSYIGNPQ